MAETTVAHPSPTATTPEAATPARRGRAPRRGLPRLVAPVLTGLLLALAFPPFDLGLLALVAPVPLLARWTGAQRARTAAADGFVAGVVFFGILLAWAWNFGAVAYGPFVVVLALYWAGAGAIVGLVASRRGTAGPWVVTSTWVLFEALRGRWPLGGFSWGEVGYAFHDVAPMRSVAAWGGVLAVSFVAVLFAAYVTRALRSGWGSGPRAALRPAGAALAVVAVVGLAHVTRIDTDPTRAVRVAVVQGNDRNRHLTPQEQRDRFLPESHFALAGTVEVPVDLVVLPESSLDEDPRIDPFLDRSIAEIATGLDTAVLTNAAVEIEDGRRLRNTNFFYRPDGTLEGTYVKQHLVPYGEYVPGRQYLGFVDELDQIPRDHAPGDERRVFSAAGVPFGSVICFESAFTEISRAYARDGAEILVVSTNNRSFGRSANSAQHVAIGQMRAAETGRPVVQAGVSGRSAFIAPDGTLLATTGLFERTLLERTVTGRSGHTPYVAVGDWIVLLSAGVLVLAAWRVRTTPARSVVATRGGFAPSSERS